MHPAPSFKGYFSSLPVGVHIFEGWKCLPSHTHTLVPSAPTIVYVEATSSTSISVYWESSENDGGSPITGYMVEYCPTSNSSFETQVITRDIFSVTLDVLTPSTEYDVRVRGENAVGRSDPSATLRTKTDGELIERLLPGVCVDWDRFFPGTYTDSRTLQATEAVVVSSEMIVVNEAFLFLT